MMISDEPMHSTYINTKIRLMSIIFNSHVMKYTDLFPKNFSRAKLLFLAERRGYFQ